MNDNEIIKALECCGNIVDSTCKGCVYHETYNASCVVRLMRDALDLINRQKAEIERLKHRKTELQIRNQELQHEKSEAIKEFQHKSESILIKLYEEYHRIANKPNNAWFKRFTKEENEMFYQGRAEAIWECISVNRDIVKEVVGDNNV